MNFSRVTLDNGTFIDTDWDTRLTSVRITDTTFGVTARGNSKCHPDDEYSPEIGYRLASVRAQARLLRKVEKKMVRDPRYVIRGR